MIVDGRVLASHAMGSRLVLDARWRQRGRLGQVGRAFTSNRANSTGREQSEGAELAGPTMPIHINEHVVGALEAQAVRAVQDGAAGCFRPSPPS